jgi:hypothetical protein
MKTKRTLDLHGIKHAKVEDELINFFFWHDYNPKGVNIITGNSKEMQKLVIDFLDKWEFKYYIPFHNLGEIIIIE